MNHQSFTIVSEKPVTSGYDSGTKYKFLAEAPGDKVQIERLYRACKGVEQVRTRSITLNCLSVINS